MYMRICQHCICIYTALGKRGYGVLKNSISRSRIQTARARLGKEIRRSKINKILLGAQRSPGPFLFSSGARILRRVMNFSEADAITAG